MSIRVVVCFVFVTLFIINCDTCDVERCGIVTEGVYDIEYAECVYGDCSHLLLCPRESDGYVFYENTVCGYVRSYECLNQSITVHVYRETYRCITEVYENDDGIYRVTWCRPLDPDSL